MKIYNLFVDIEEFELLDFTFVREKNYEQIKKNAYTTARTVENLNVDSKGKVEIETYEIQEEIGEHIHTYTAKKKGEQINSLFYEDGTSLNDIVVLLRFFLGSYVCLENELKITWCKYEGSPLEHPLAFKSNVLPKITTIMEGLKQEKVNANKLDKLLLLYFEVFKAAYIDIKIAIISPIINILVDIFNKDENNNNNEDIDTLITLKEKINEDSNYTEIEKQQLSIAITKMINGLGTDFTTKTVKFIQRLNLINRIQDVKLEENITILAQLINTLRNGIVHSGNLSASGIERKFKGAKLNDDEGTLKGKIRVYSIGIVLVQNAILELLGIDNYHFIEQDIVALEEYFQKGTFREY